MSIHRDLKVVAKIHRKDNTRPLKRDTRYYADTDTAIPRLSVWLMHFGIVGDVCTVTHRHTGKWLGEVKIKTDGSFTSKWVWDSPEF